MERQTAKLFLKSGSIRGSLKHALSLCDDTTTLSGTNNLFSLSQSFENADRDFLPFPLAETN